MKCEKCVEEGTTSEVYPGGGTSTLMYCPPYYDEQGKYHHHDRNTHTTDYRCSNGHRWKLSEQGMCPSCDFGKSSSKTIYY